MATSTLYSETNKQHLELFSLIWLDPNRHETRQTEQKLRSIINRIKRFHQLQQCQQYIEQISSKERIVLIVSGQLGKQLVPLIHHQRQIISIYVYCMNIELNQQWSLKYSKIKSVVNNLDELIYEIKLNHHIQKKVEEPLSINIFNNKSTSSINEKFVFQQILIDCLLELKSTNEDKKELIKCCENEYEGNVGELEQINEFEKEYSSKKVLWWYTKESFFYKILNSSLRMENIHLIFLFRSFIKDIYDQLKQNQMKSSIKVYRSQMMSKDEVNILKGLIGQFISINSFFSTSLSRSSALSFLNMSDGVSSDNLEKVLFEIHADPNMVTTKPFADITKFSDFSDESEVLFMIGSIFRVESIDRNDDDSGIWIIKMNLCSDEENHLKKVLQHMKKQLGNDQINLRTFGKLLWQMGQFKLAEMYFERFLKHLPPNDPLRPVLYKDLAELASQSGDFDKSVEWTEKLVTFEEEKKVIRKSSEKKPNNPIIKSIVNPKLNSMKRKWKQDGITVAGGNGEGDQFNQFNEPHGISIDDENETIYIADTKNHRIMKWKMGEKEGEVVAGENGKGERIDQLNEPRDVILDKRNNSLFISDYLNGRVVQWSYKNGIKQRIIISNIYGYGLALDNNGDLYVSTWVNNEVRRWKEGETSETIVAGGNGHGHHLNQLYRPTNIFVDKEYSVYVSDSENNRVMKWKKDAREGIVVAGGNGEGKNLNQLNSPAGVIVDDLNNVYVVDSINSRIMCWPSGSSEGSVVVGGNGIGNEVDKFSCPEGLSFDCEGNLFVVDSLNHRIQKFEVDLN